MFTTYPKNIDEKILYYVEYHKFEDRPETYKIYQRNFFNSDNLDKNDVFYELCREVHPYVLLEGKVAPEHHISLETKKYLEFVVDAMNEKVLNSKK